MSAQRKRLVELVENLPADLEQEVTDFVLFLIEKRQKSEFSPPAPKSDLQNDDYLRNLPDDPLLAIAEVADRLDLRSGRSDVSSRASELAGEAIVEEFNRRRKEQDADTQDSH